MLTKEAHLLSRHRQRVHKGRGIPDVETSQSQRVRQDCSATIMKLSCPVGEELIPGQEQNQQSGIIKLTHGKVNSQASNNSSTQTLLTSAMF